MEQRKTHVCNEGTVPRWPATALQEACNRLGINCQGAQLLRIGQCATIALPVVGLVARVARPTYPPSALETELRFARLVHHAGLPVLAPADEVISTPICTRDGPVTFWPLLWPEESGACDWEWLGYTLRRLHQLPVPHDLASLWNPCERITTRLAVYASQPHARTDYVAILSAACTTLQGTLLPVHGTRGVVHGDATPSNVVVTRRGPVLIDFDLAGVGPLEWDLTAAVVLHRRFGLPAEHLQRFLAAYDCELTLSKSFPLWLRLRELLYTSFALASSGESVRAEQELEVRMRAWVNPDDCSVWRRS